MYEFFDHTADVGIRINARDLNTLFADAGTALSALIVEDLSGVRPAQEIAIAVPGADRDYLLFDWLNELLRQFEETRLLCSRFDVRVEDDGLAARAWGEPLDRERHRPGNEVKAITYHQLEVRKTPDGWTAQVIVDI